MHSLLNDTEWLKQTIFPLAYKEYNSFVSMKDVLFDVKPTDKPYERGTARLYTANWKEVQEHETPDEGKRIESYSWVCKIKEFKADQVISKTAVRQRDMSIAEIGEQLAKQLRQFEEEYWASVFNNGALTAGDDVFDNTVPGLTGTGKLTYDGKAFFATDHPDKVGNTFSNYNTSTNLTTNSLKAVLSQYKYTNAFDDAGNKIVLQPDILLVPNPIMKFKADEILGSTLAPDVDTGANNVLQNIIQAEEWNFLSDSDAWFLGKRKEGICIYEQLPFTMYVRDLDQSRYRLEAARAFGVVVKDWRWWLANNIASS